MPALATPTAPEAPCPETVEQRAGPAEAWPLVFVVDDDEFLRSLIGDWIEDAGFRVVRLDCGEACLAAFARERPVAVLLDVHMSGISGAETLDLIRAADAEVPVITLSAESDARAVLDLVERGASEFLLKPVLRTSLVSSLVAVARCRPVVASP
jgi:FixJ family two-component response regulator